MTSGPRTKGSKNRKLTDGASLDLTSDLYNQPGHLIRRAQQISVSMFHSVVGMGVSPLQYAILRLLEEHPNLDQVTVSRLCGLDTSTTAALAARLEERSLIKRIVPSDNKRIRLLRLTRSGKRLLDDLVPAVQELKSEMLSTLPKQEQVVFLRLLKKFVRLNNERSRAPLRQLDPEFTSDDDS